MGEKKDENVHGHQDAGRQARTGPFEMKSLFVGMLALLVLVVAYNQYQIGALSSLPVPKELVAVQVAAVSSGGQQAGGAGSLGSWAPRSGNSSAILAADPRPSGVPAIYGAELGVKYDDVSEADPGLADATIRKLSAYENDNLNSEQMQRYVKLGTSIACEYCCGAQSLIFSNGQRACGCAHSYAMRGLAKYLIQKHGGEYTDDQILEEMGKWKVLFFPGVHAQKAAALEKSGIALNYVNLASNKYRGAEKGSVSGSGSSMVGGC